MPYGRFLLVTAVVASVFFLQFSHGPHSGFVGVDAYADEASDALKKCDDLASHPLDGRRYSPPVPDDRFAPGAAIDACEAAVKLNPDSARALFELGRSYWMMGGERDKDAFADFLQAAKRGYPIALKFIGDAYLEGRGLPNGESQNPQVAIAWYRKAVAAGFAAAQSAIDEVQAQIDKQTLLKQKTDMEADLKAQQDKDKIERERFDSSIFQNNAFMSKIFNHDDTLVNKNYFVLYLDGFVNDIGGTKVLYINGQKCLPQVAATTTAGVIAQAL
jgi:TPR repeat protein